MDLYDHSYDDTFDMDLDPVTSNSWGPYPSDQPFHIDSSLNGIFSPETIASLPGLDLSNNAQGNVKDLQNPDKDEVWSLPGLDLPPLPSNAPESVISMISTRSRASFSRDSRKLLDEIFINDPYPSESTREGLADKCGVRVKSINNWFANKRSRTKPQTTAQGTEHSTHCIRATNITEAIEPSSGGVIMPELPSPPSYTPLTESSLNAMLKQLESLDQQLPMEKYLHTPLEEERVDVSRIQTLMAEERSTGTSRVDSLFHSTSSPNTISSATFFSSVGSANSRSSKKGRRQHCNTFKTVVRTPEGFFRRILKVKERRFYCTFCGQCFRHHYEWKRHEESVHVPRKVWVCIVTGCPLETFDQRLFFRKDNFFGHVRRCHGFPEDASMPTSPLYVEQFVISLAPIPSDHRVLKCGFCGEYSSTWENRVSHVSEHFKRGIDLSSWWMGRKGCTPGQRLMGSNRTTTIPTRIEWDAANISCSSQSPGQFWSCRFFPNATKAFDDLHFCMYCSIHFADRETEQLQHMLSDHQFRACEQELFCNSHDLRNHLIKVHNFAEYYDELHKSFFSLYLQAHV